MQKIERLLIAVVFLTSFSNCFGASSEDLFEMRVRPLLAANCYSCHAASKMGGLRVDSREALLQGGNDGPAIAPGDPDKSLLIQAVRYSHARFKMPPQTRLSDQEVASLADWVKQGAVWPESPKQSAQPLWSLQPIRKPPIPEVKNAAWSSSAIDRLIFSNFEAKHLKPVRAADKRTLIRRATLDLTGLPPTPEEVDAFQRDTSPGAFAKVVDRLLASPHYGERWARYWLDIARYSDDVMFGTPPNFYQYRDWVVKAFNDDMPYDLFVKAQFAADLLPGVDNRKLLPALTIFVDTSNEFADDDRVDVTTRGFLGLTVACARCHDHKYDPIPTKDYYALLGVFRSTQYREVPLAPGAIVEDYQKHKKAVDDQQEALTGFLHNESMQLVDVLAGNTARYLMASWEHLGPKKIPAADAARNAGLDPETLERWIHYIGIPAKQHPFLKPWEKLLAEGADETSMRAEAEKFQEFAVQTIEDKKRIDEYNKAVSYGYKAAPMLGDVVGKTMDRARFMLWQDLVAEGNPRPNVATTDPKVDGILYYKGETVERFMPESWRDHLASMRKRLKILKSQLPPQYPYLSVIEDVPKPQNLHVFIRGNAQNPGIEAPRAFLTALRQCAPEPFQKGSGRLELAEAITSPNNPLTARVIVNRIWERHFGYGIVRTPSNFGMAGDRPADSELLDYLASRLIEDKWSIKTLQREIMLSAAYALSSEGSPANEAVDEENRFHWRFNEQRLDIEALRDSIFFTAGDLDETTGGPATPLELSRNHRRTIYGVVSREYLSTMLSLFDFPNPNLTSENRVSTTVPSQRLFLLNSDMMIKQSSALCERIAKDAGADSGARIRRAYSLLFQREPTPKEIDLGLVFLQTGPDAWPQYAQALLASNEFLYEE